MDAFIVGALDTVTPGGSVWGEWGPWTIRAPETDPSACTVLIGDDIIRAAVRSPLLETSGPGLGWTMIRPPVGTLHDGAGDVVRQDERLLRRLGISPSRLVVVATYSSWREGVELATWMPQSVLILLALPGDRVGEAFDRTFVVGDGARSGVNQVLNTRSLADSTVFLLPSDEAHHAAGADAEAVGYPSEQVFMGSPVGLRRIVLALWGVQAAHAAGGNVARYLKRYWSQTSVQMPTGFLMHLEGDARFGRRTMVQLELSRTGLHCFGFDIAPWTASTGWGSRRHLLRLQRTDGAGKMDVSLGVLRREILDALLNLTAGAETQAFGAFGLAGNLAFPWTELGDGEYQVLVLDEVGCDIVEMGGVRLVNHEILVPGRVVSVLLRDGKVFLRISSHG